MNAQSAELDWMLPDDLAAPTRSPAFETALAAWPLVAALAWQGYCDRGRGTVMLDEEGQLAYHPGSPCECHQADVELYDPKRQAVVALHKGTRIDSVLVVAGWPAPPDAYRITPAERLRLTAH